MACHGLDGDGVDVATVRLVAGIEAVAFSLHPSCNLLETPAAEQTVLDIDPYIHAQNDLGPAATSPPTGASCSTVGQIAEYP